MPNEMADCPDGTIPKGTQAEIEAACVLLGAMLVGGKAHTKGCRCGGTGKVWALPSGQDTAQHRKPETWVTWCPRCKRKTHPIYDGTVAEFGGYCGQGDYWISYNCSECGHSYPRD